MGLMCSFGLAACIAVGGSSYSESDFYDISYQCEMARSNGFFNEASFILINGRYRQGFQQGYLALEKLEEMGVDFRWKPKGGRQPQHALSNYRKKQLINSCHPFLNYSGN